MRPGAQLAVVGLGTLVVPLDTTVNVAFPHIVTAFAIPVPAVKWLVISYVLTHAGLMLAAGRLGDLFGYRRIFLIGCAWSACAFALCTLAPSYEFLLAARALQGVGAALVLSVGPALVTIAYPPERRVKVLALYTMVFAIGAAIGPVLGGMLIATWGWSAVYAFRIPLALLAFAFAFTLPTGPARTQARFDFAHFRNPILVMALVAGIGVNLAGFAILLLGPFLLRLVADLSPVAGGAVLMASPLGMVIAAPLAERLAAILGMRRLTALGLVITSTGLFLLGAGLPGMAAMAAAMFVQGFGQGLFQVANFDLITGALPAKDRGVAGGLAMLTRSVGLMLGATLLMLLAQTLSGSPGLTASGIQSTYLVAALLPVILLIAMLRTSSNVGR